MCFSASLIYDRPRGSCGNGGGRGGGLNFHFWTLFNPLERKLQFSGVLRVQPCTEPPAGKLIFAPDLIIHLIPILKNRT